MLNIINNKSAIIEEFNKAPNDVKHLIICEASAGIIQAVVGKEVFSSQDVKSAGQSLVGISLVCKEFNAFNKKNLENAKEIFRLYNKYHCLNNNYLELGNRLNNDPDKKSIPKGCPQLLDAVSSGRNNRLSSFRIFSPEIEKDIINIVTLMPRSILCDMGNFRCNDFVTPLMMACFNAQIPMRIIEFLLKNGADPYTTIHMNCKKTPMLIALDKVMTGVNDIRKEEIEALFKKYGVVVESYS